MVDRPRGLRYGRGMLRRLRIQAVRAPRAFLSLLLLAFALPALAGPLAYCLEGTEGPRVVAATEHCASMAEAADPVHLPALEEGVGSGAGGSSPITQSPGFWIHLGGVLSPLPELLPSRDDAYGGAASDGPWPRALAGGHAGRSVRLLI